MTDGLTPCFTGLLSSHDHHEWFYQIYEINHFKSYLKTNFLNWHHIDGLVQDRRNSSASSLELLLSCTNPSIFSTSRWHEANTCSNENVKGYTAVSFIWSCHIFHSTGSNLLLQRLLVKKGFAEPFQLLSFDSETNLCPVVYVSKWDVVYAWMSKMVWLTHLPRDKMAAILADNIFKCIFLNEKFCILIKISLKFVPKGPIDYN